jgi:hypothetical protein
MTSMIIEDTSQVCISEYFQKLTCSRVDILPPSGILSSHTLIERVFVENCKRLVGGIADTEYGLPRCQPLGVGSKNRET